MALWRSPRGELSGHHLIVGREGEANSQREWRRGRCQTDALVVEV